MPKSVSFGSPSMLYRMLSGFRSRMDDFFLADEFQSASDLDAGIEHIEFIYSAIFLDQPVEVSTVSDFHDEVFVTFEMAVVVDLYDIGVVQEMPDIGLRGKPSHGVCVIGKFRLHISFTRNVTSWISIVRTVHSGHAARAYTRRVVQTDRASRESSLEWPQLLQLEY